MDIDLKTFIEKYTNIKPHPAMMEFLTFVENNQDKIEDMKIIHARSGPKISILKKINKRGPRKEFTTEEDLIIVREMIKGGSLTSKIKKIQEQLPDRNFHSIDGRWRDIKVHKNEKK